jgi:hypothetical protein
MDPFSFATGVAGLISLADLVATKGYRYLKAVKDCDEEVKQLMVELDFFGGVLRRLEKVAKEEEDAEGFDVEGCLCQRVLAVANSGIQSGARERLHLRMPNHLEGNKNHSGRLRKKRDAVDNPK